MKRMPESKAEQVLQQSNIEIESEEGLKKTKNLKDAYCNEIKKQEIREKWGRIDRCSLVETFLV